MRVTEYPSDGGPATQVVTNFYDAENRWIGQSIDRDGDGVVDHTRWFGYDGNQIVVQFDREGGGRVRGEDQSHRYLWGPAVDQLLADERLAALAPEQGAGYDLRVPGEVLWPLADHLGTVRDLAEYDAQTGVTTVVEHRLYDAFGKLKWEAPAAGSSAPSRGAVDFLFGFTGRPLDSATGLQNNLHRWYDASVGRWLSPDPLGLAAGDSNPYRYVGNTPTNVTDPSGLEPWKAIARILGLKWGEQTCKRGAKEVATELLKRLGPYRPTDPEAQKIIKQLKAMGWVEMAMGKGTHAGQGMILREIQNGKKTGRMLEWHPGGGHHGPNPHWKFSSGESGTLRYLGGTVGAIAVAAIPGVAQAQEGDWNGAARDVAIELSPLAWAKMGWQALGAFFDACERDLYGDDYHREMERYRKEFWEKRK